MANTWQDNERWWCRFAEMMVQNVVQHYTPPKRLMRTLGVASNFATTFVMYSMDS